MVLIMGIDCVIYARMQRKVMNSITFFHVNLLQMRENYTLVNIFHTDIVLKSKNKISIIVFLIFNPKDN